jgi:hypothetical protein
MIILFFIIALAFVVACFKYPHLAVGFFFCGLVSLGTTFGFGVKFLGFQLPYSDIVFLLAFPSSICSMVIRRKLKAKITPEIYLFMIWIIIGIIAALIKGNELTLIRNDLRYLLLTILIYYWVVLVIRNRNDVLFIFKMMALGVILGFLRVAIVAISGVNVQQIAEMVGVYSRTTPGAVDINRFIPQGSDTYFVITPLIFLTFILNGRSILRNIYIVMIFICSIMGLIITLTRSLWFGFVFGVILVFISTGRRLLSRAYSLKIISMVILSILLTIVITNIIGDRSINITNKYLFIDRFNISRINSANDLSFRQHEVATIVNNVSSSLLNGNGFGASYLLIHEDGIYMTTFSHNIIAWILLKTGILGLIMYLSMITLLIIHNIKTSSQISDMKIVLTSGTIAIIILLFVSLFINRMISADGSAFLGFTLALYAISKTVSESNGRASIIIKHPLPLTPRIGL